jgi:flagellar hook-basal body complex protein FliE
MMTAIAPVESVRSLLSELVRQVQPAPTADFSFTSVLTSGLKEVDAKVAEADALVRAFAEGQTIPVHQVTVALEQARLAVELATQVRGRLIETYREFMTMQV